jgi:IPT/TIG domain
MRRVILVMGVLIVGLVLCRESVQSVHAADYILSGDSDCAVIGIWNAATKTCTLNRNVHGSIEVLANDVTLDGAGYAIIGPGANVGAGEGLRVAHRNGAPMFNFRLENVTLTGWGVGVLFFRAYNASIASTTIVRNNFGIGVSDSPFLTITDTLVAENNLGLEAGNSFAGLALHRVAFDGNGSGLRLNIHGSVGTNLSIDTSNTVNGKPIYYFEGIAGETHEHLGEIAMLMCQNCSRVTFGHFSINGDNGLYSVGLQLWGSDDNIVNHGVFNNVKVCVNLSNSKRNFFHDNTFNIVNRTPDLGPAIGVGVAVDPFQNIENWFLDNNFIEPEPVTAATRPALTRNANFGSNTHFYSPLLERGNYWSRFDTPAEGCVDQNNDRKCDGRFGLDDGGPYATPIYYAWTVQNAWAVPPSVPTIVSISPTSGPTGTLVTITGANFGSAQGSSTVSFASTVAAVSSWSDTQIQATVPSLPAGNYSVVVTTSAGSSNPSVFDIEQKTLCSLDGINDADFERAFPEIKKYLNFCKLGRMAYSGWHTSGPSNPLDCEGRQP